MPKGPREEALVKVRTKIHKATETTNTTAFIPYPFNAETKTPSN